MEEKRVVGLAGELGHGQCGSVGKVVSLADDELVEAVARVQRARRLVSCGGERAFRGSAGARVRSVEGHPGPAAEDLTCASLHHASESVRNPLSSGRWRGQPQELPIPGREFDRGDPDLERGVAHDPPDFDADRPRFEHGLRVRVQRQTNPSQGATTSDSRGPGRKARRGGEYTTVLYAPRGLYRGVGAKREKK